MNLLFHVGCRSQKLISMEYLCIQCGNGLDPKCKNCVIYAFDHIEYQFYKSVKDLLYETIVSLSNPSNNGLTIIKQNEPIS
jgi:hypothetical protein